MKVKILRNLSTSWPVQFTEGQEVDVSQDVGDTLVREGLAICVESGEKADCQAVPVKKQKAVKKESQQQEPE